MGKIIAVANQKGGVGKTTTCVNLACALYNEKKRVLLCDCDPQGNATSGFGEDKRGDKGTYALLTGGEAADNIITTKYGDLIPASRDLAGATIELVGAEDREHVLRRSLKELRDRYDYIIVDCPPSLELLTLNALCAADTIIIPVQCEYFALEGLSDLIRTVRTIRRRLNPDLEIEGILLTMFDGRTHLSSQVAEEVKKYFKDKVYASVIPRNVRLSEAPSRGMPVMAYDYASRGAQAYIALAREIIKKNEKH